MTGPPMPGGPQGPGPTTPKSETAEPTSAEPETGEPITPQQGGAEPTALEPVAASGGSWSTPGAGPVCWIDVRFGVAGDMLVGALVDAGASLADLQRAVDAVIPGAVRLGVAEVQRAGLRARQVSVTSLAPDPPHRRWTDIRALLDGADLPEPVRMAARGVFARLAAAEARVHGVPPDDVHFHEVGAWDSIADIVAACAALHDLGVTAVSAGPIALGSGVVRTAHGELPVPVPAVLELAAGWVVLSGGSGELATPTGLALVTTLAAACTELPPMRVRAVGVGAGTRDAPGRPNVVRVVLGTAAEAGPGSDDSGAELATGVVIEANVDDVDPRVWPSVLADLLDAGAADAWLTPILMKKGRPAHTLSVLCAPAAAPALRDRVVALVPTLGVRESTVVKHALGRTWRTVDVDGQQVRIKLGLRAGAIVTATPEFEDVAAAAHTLGIPVRDMLARAGAAASRAGLVTGAAPA